MYKTLAVSAVFGALVLCFGAGEARAGDYDLLIIANTNANASSASKAELRSYFLKKRSSWKGGGRVIPVNSPAGSRLRKAFQSKVLSMSESDEDEYWKNEGIRRGGQKPAEISNTLKAVYHLRGSVSYVFRKDYKGGVVKILAVF
jgi:ABC-type phosphate transport system substrate-binding protein